MSFFHALLRGGIPERDHPRKELVSFTAMSTPGTHARYYDPWLVLPVGLRVGAKAVQEGDGRHFDDLPPRDSARGYLQLSLIPGGDGRPKS